jgi:lysophospholipase L1-like esterase
VNIRMACVAGILGTAGCGSAPTGSSPYSYSNASSADGAAAATSDASPAPALPAQGDVPDGSAATGSEPEGAGGDGDGSSGSATDDAAAAACATGQVTADQVVVLGDSYLDPVWANTALDIYGDAQEAGSLAANTTYRHYDIGGASMAWGNPGTQWYIPYQYDPMAKTDLSVANPSDIKVIIMDGGGNDVLIGNTSCETTAPPGNTSCATTVQNAIDKAQSTMQEMVADGVESIVYFFYPHLDPAGGGILLTPAPTVNDTLDYAYPLAESVCCGSPFTSTASNYSCTGQPVPGASTKCVFVDTRPAFEGHLADYIKSDNVHPTPAGAQVIANLVWQAMKANCIAQ